MTGDTLTDIEAAATAGVRCVGYANKPGKAAAMVAAGADVVIKTIDELAASVERTGLRPSI